MTYTSTVMKTLAFSLCAAIVLAFSSTFLLAQDIVINGKILDKRGHAVPGTNVLVSGTNSGTAVGADGIFELKLNPGKYTLVISMIGYNTIEHKVAVEKAINTGWM